MLRQIKMPLESRGLQTFSEAADDDLRSVANQARYLVRLRSETAGYSINMA